MRHSSWRADSSHPGRSACADRQYRSPNRTPPPYLRRAKWLGVLCATTRQQGPEWGDRFHGGVPLGGAIGCHLHRLC
jgi:hypothetical protein